MAQQEMSRWQVNELIAGFATQSPKYREALLKDPRKVLSMQLGQEVPANVTIKVVQDTPTTFHLVLPHSTAEGAELSDAELESVAGGKAKANNVYCTTTGGIGSQISIESKLV